MSVRHTVARVDLGAIESNLRAISGFVSASVEPRSSLSAPRVIAVVKANAYGHGAVPVGLALERAGAAMLACADIEEGVVLRRGGVRIPILVFGALGVSDLDGVFEYGLTPTISTPSAARALAAKVRGQTPSVQTTGVRPRSSDYTPDGVEKVESQGMGSDSGRRIPHPDGNNCDDAINGRPPTARPVRRPSRSTEN